MDKVDFEFKINNKNYNEHFAMYLLKSIYGDSFKNAKVADRPDIWIENDQGVGCIGFEITTLLDTYYNTLKKYKKAWSKMGLTIEQIAKQVPSLLKNKIGINSHGNLVLIGNEKRHTLSKSLKGLESTIISKLNKLQYYRPFQSQNLFIFATNLSPVCSTNKIQDVLKKIDQSKYKETFENIFIFNYEELQIFNFASLSSPESIPISEDVRLFCDKLAEQEQKKIETEYNKRLNNKKQNKKLIAKNKSKNKSENLNESEKS